MCASSSSRVPKPLRDASLDPKGLPNLADRRRNPAKDGLRQELLVHATSAGMPMDSLAYADPLPRARPPVKGDVYVYILAHGTGRMPRKSQKTGAGMAQLKERGVTCSGNVTARHRHLTPHAMGTHEDSSLERAAGW